MRPNVSRSLNVSMMPAEPKRFPLLAAYDLCLKCSHLFNILDARGAISVTERVGVIARVRALAVGIAKAWVRQQSDPHVAAAKKRTVAQKRSDESHLRTSEGPISLPTSEIAQHDKNL